MDDTYTIPAGQQAIIVLIEDNRATQVVLRGRDPISGTADLLHAANQLAEDAAALIAARLVPAIESVPPAAIGGGEVIDHAA